MTATKQLWLAVLLLMALLFACTTALNTYWAKQSLLRDMAVQTGTDAQAIVSHLAASNPTNRATLPSQVAPERYERVQVTRFDGTIAATGSTSATAGATAPGWFSEAFDIRVPTADAPIVENGQTVGLVSLEANAAPIVDTLWQLALQTAAVFAAGALLLALLGTGIVQRILRSVRQVVTQAEGLTGGNFTAAQAPPCQEVAPAALALNNLGANLQKRLEKKAASPAPKASTEEDPLTGLGCREALMRALKAELRRTDTGLPASLCIVHLNDLRTLNRQYGRNVVDSVLGQIGKQLTALCRQSNDWFATRLRGADFAVFAPHTSDPEAVAHEVQQALAEVLRARGMEAALQLPIATTQVTRGQSAKATLARLDGALAAAIGEGGSRVYLTGEGDLPMRPVEDQLREWRAIFEQSFSELNFSLATYPVAGLEGNLLHLESPAVLHWQNRALPASQFLPWIHSLELAADLDKRVIELALAHIHEHDQTLCIHLSAAALSEPGFLIWLKEKLSADEGVGKKLGIEFSEESALRFIVPLSVFAERVRAMGVRVGIEHVGHQLSELGKLSEVALDYIKIDSRFVNSIDQNRGNQTLVRTLCAISQEQGVISIAEGVSSPAERDMLATLGIDGVTGPGVSLPLAPAAA